MLSNLPFTVIIADDEGHMRVRAAFEYWQEAMPFARATSVQYPDHVIVLVEERGSGSTKLISMLAGETVDLHASGIGLRIGPTLAAHTRSGPVNLVEAVKEAATQPA